MRQVSADVIEDPDAARVAMGLLDLVEPAEVETGPAERLFPGWMACIGGLAWA